MRKILSTAKKVRNGLLLFLGNVLLYHVLFILGIYTVGRIGGVHSINFLILFPSCVYVLILLVYEKPLLKTLYMNPKVYWLLTVIVPTVVYGVFWCSYHFVRGVSIEPLTIDPWYLLFFGIFFFFASVMIGVVKTILYIVRRVKK